MDRQVLAEMAKIKGKRTFRGLNVGGEETIEGSDFLGQLKLCSTVMLDEKEETGLANSLSII